MSAEKPWLFQKGQSGNPHGPRRGAKGLAKYIRTKTSDGKSLADFVLEVASGRPIPVEGVLDPKTKQTLVHKPTMSDRQWAINWLSDRGFGKPVTSIELADVTELQSPLSTPQLEDMSPEKLAQLQALLEEAAGETKPLPEPPEPMILIPEVVDDDTDE